MGTRYSIAFLAQGNRDAVIEGSAKKCPVITAANYLNQGVRANCKGY